MRSVLLVAKMLTKNARMTAQAIIRGRLDELDGIVHENGCHKRAAFVVQQSRNGALCAEAALLVAEAQAVEKVVQHKMNKMALPEVNRSVREIFDDLEIDLRVSPQMCALMRNHFVTVGKVYRLDEHGKEIAARIDLPALTKRLGARKFQNVGMLNAMIRMTQTALGVSSIAFIQAEAARVGGALGDGLSARLGLAAQRDISEASGGLHERCTPALYEMKTILARAKQQRTLFLVKQYVQGEGVPIGVFYCAGSGGGGFAPLGEAEVGQLDPKAPVFVLKGVTPLSLDGLKEGIAAVGFSEVCLANAACIPQFGLSSVTALPAEAAARAETEAFRTLASEKGCSLKNPSLFAIVHTYPNTVGRECATTRLVETI